MIVDSTCLSVSPVPPLSYYFIIIPLSPSPLPRSMIFIIVTCLPSLAVLFAGLSVRSDTTPLEKRTSTLIECSLFHERPSILPCGPPLINHNSSPAVPKLCTAQPSSTTTTHSPNPHVHDTQLNNSPSLCFKPLTA